MHQLPNKDIWTGRSDPQYGKEGRLWYQAVHSVDLNETIFNQSVVLLGFASDEGVRRNFGRPGAIDGPDSIRKALCGLAFAHDRFISDGGNFVVSHGNLEGVQAQCAGIIFDILTQKSIPILLGGGHELSYAHFKGVLEFAKDKRVGIINFDPHLDVRTYEQGAHSGSWARQILDEYPNAHYLPIGINPQVNVQALFTYMEAKNQSFLTMDDLIMNTDSCMEAISDFASEVDILAVTLDMDVFSGALAPGVSAPAAYGAFPQHIKPLLDELASTGKWLSFDVAEVNPSFDDGRTAKLAALMVDEVIGYLDL